MKITIYGEKLYECELKETEVGEYELIKKSENIDEVSCGFIQTEKIGFVNNVEIYLK